MYKKYEITYKSKFKILLCFIGLKNLLVLNVNVHPRDRLSSSTTEAKIRSLSCASPNKLSTLREHLSHQELIQKRAHQRVIYIGHHDHPVESSVYTRVVRKRGLSDVLIPLSKNVRRDVYFFLAKSNINVTDRLFDRILIQKQALDQKSRTYGSGTVMDPQHAIFNILGYPSTSRNS